MKTKPLISALNDMLRCYDYGNSTTNAEWQTAVVKARAALAEVQAAKRAKSTLPNRASLNPGAVAELVPVEPSPFLVQTTSETLTAYADCVADNVMRKDAMRVRNLSFKSAHPVTVAEARAILSKAIVGGYNEFEPKLLRYLPQDRMVYIAREGSPCLYVLGAEFEQDMKLTADEFDFYPDKYVKTYGKNQFTIPGPVTRIWFD
jgi:hypothetical protein